MANAIPNDGNNNGTSAGVMQQQSAPGQGAVMGNSGTTDPYSYYGQLPTKPSTTYMPRTANFSNFGK